jgi:hypothetical protein
MSVAEASFVRDGIENAQPNDRLNWYVAVPRDLRGRRLFPDRHTHTVTFRLSRQEYDLYKSVTAYINQFLPQGSGRRQASVALARTVFQRRLASSTMAIQAEGGYPALPP